jgi:hypothetical protein
MNTSKSIILCYFWKIKEFVVFLQNINFIIILDFMHFIINRELNQGETYLEKPYLFDKNGIYLILWANGKYGYMVESNNNNELHFVEYTYVPGNDDDSDNRQIQRIEKDSYPLVASGIVVYWLKEHHVKSSTAQIFEEYFELCKQRYIRKEERSLNAFERDLPREFAMKWHPTYEMDRIEKSEAIFPYLKEKDVNTIKDLTDSYINFVRKKIKELYPPQYTEGCEKTEAFLHIYETTAKKCVKWICDEYDLPPMGPHHGEDRGKKILNYESYNNRHNKIDPRYIRLGFHDFADQNLSEVIDEINGNLSKCIDQDARIRYVIKLLSSFKEFAQPFYPIGKIKEWKQSIEEHKKWKANWEKVADDVVDETTGKPLDSKGKIKSCEEEIESMEADIKYWNEKARKLYNICQEAFSHHRDNKEVSIELCLYRFWSEMINFYRRLTALLLTYKLKLMDIQEKCGVYLNWYVHLPDYVDEKYVPNYGYAKQLLSEIERTNVIETKPIDTYSKNMVDAAIAAVKAQIPHVEYDQQNEGLSIVYGDNKGKVNLDEVIEKKAKDIVNKQFEEITATDADIDEIFADVYGQDLVDQVNKKMAEEEEQNDDDEDTEEIGGDENYEEDEPQEEWDDTYDGVFKEGLNPQKIFNKLEKMTYPRVTDVYPRTFVYFKVLLYLGWIENHQKNFLKWANCHWGFNWMYDYNFKFGNNIKKELRDTDMSDWGDKTCKGSDIGKAYRCLAQRVLDVFAEKVNDGKTIDRMAFYKEGVKSRINDGKKLAYPF